MKKYVVRKNNNRLKNAALACMISLGITALGACRAQAPEESESVAGDVEEKTTAQGNEENTNTEGANQVTDNMPTGTIDNETETTSAQKQEEETTTESGEPDYIYEQLSSDTEQIQVSENFVVSQELLDELNGILKSCQYRISFKAVSIDGSKCISYNSEAEYFAASAIKAPYLLYCYQQLDAGNGTLDETMVYTSKYYREGTGTIKDSAEGTVYPLSEIMRRTIWNSDNSGYYMCADRWGKDGYNQLMEQIGAEGLKMPKHSIWLYDVKVGDFIIAWKSIYDYFQTETVGAKTFYESTTNCKWNLFGEGIKNCTIAQKYGWADDSFVNAGIVYGENETYILAVFTDAEGENSQIREFANVVKKIHNIMDK